MDSCLPNHSRVKEDSRVGWTSESNIYWNTNIFKLIDRGVGDLEMEDYPNRGFFWVRLEILSQPGLTIFVSTAHFPWAGCHAELETGMNQRIPATHRVCDHLRRLLPVNEPAIFGGDFNDDFHPLRILNEEFGMTDVFECLDLSPPITHPLRPSSPSEEMKPNRTLDWITCNLPSSARVIGAFVKTVRGGSLPPPSDHAPVIAFFELSAV